MTLSILLIALVILLCVLINRFTQKLGIPVLLAFILLGLVFGSEGIFKISFENYDLAEKVCSAALIFIMFYGGFGTNWKEARCVAGKSALLATFGVIFTAGITGFVCYWILNIPLLESLLIGSVLSSTDAASVFSILRSKKLGLKNNTDSLLELESGSNDPCSFMLTTIILSIMNTGVDASSIVYLVLSQFFFGILVGLILGFGSAFFMRRFHFHTDGFDMAFVISIALFSFAASSFIGGNGYLSTYLCGIILGNRNIPNQKALVHFFDGVTGLVQMLIFFLLGLLATPSRIPSVFLTSLIIMVILTFVARPLSVFAILSPFKCSIRQQAFVSFAGLRGAASIVFAIVAVVKPPLLQNDLYHIVFCIVLLSIAFQGTFLPGCAKLFDMNDLNIDVFRTFSDYSEEVELHLEEVAVKAGQPSIGKTIQEFSPDSDELVVMIIRDDKPFLPNGQTTIEKDDILVIHSQQSS